MAMRQTGQNERKLLSLSNKPLVKFLMAMLSAVSLGSCAGITYVLKNVPKCELPKVEGALGIVHALSLSGKDVIFSLAIGLGSYAATLAFTPAMDKIYSLKAFCEKGLDQIFFENEDVETVDNAEATPSWPKLANCLSAMSHCINLEDTVGSSDDDSQSHDSALLIDAPLPTPRSSTAEKDLVLSAQQRQSALEKKKRTLERRLKTEAKFYALQERLGELLARGASAPVDGEKEAPFFEPVNKTRQAMLKLSERLEVVDQELALLED
jgi:hypothetical protein